MMIFYEPEVYEFAEDIIEFDIYQNQTKLVEISFANRTFSWDEVTNLYEANGAVKQVFEWWSISERLSEQLAFHKHIVLVNSHCIWWGRTTAEPDLLADGILLDIVSRMMQAH